MSNVIFTIGLLCLVVGLAPLPIDEQAKEPRDLKIHQVYHEKCTITDKEM